MLVLPYFRVLSSFSPSNERVSGVFRYRRGHSSGLASPRHRRNLKGNPHEFGVPNGRKIRYWGRGTSFGLDRQPLVAFGLRVVPLWSECWRLVEASMNLRL